MKRTPLVRKTPLRRSKLRLAVNHAIGAFRSSQHHGDAITYALRGTKATKHARRPRGREFMGWTSRQSCMVCRFFDRLHVAARGNVLMLGLPQHYRCDGRIEVDHAGCRFKQGDGTRAFDWTCIPLCKRHHEMRTNHGGTLGQAGVFFGYSKLDMRRWCDAAIALHHSLANVAGVAIPNC